ncbi:MAG: hypothetical protein P1V97_11600 [Planctomycetota bacterium]|nr:hypothetical protein [Planctomycetota bacterium]
MDKVNLRLNSILVTFTLSLLSSACVGYYAMSQSGLQASQAAEIRQERKLGEQLQRDIERVEQDPDWASIGAVTETLTEIELPPVFGTFQAMTLDIQPVENTVAPAFHELINRQRQELNLRLGVLGQTGENEARIYR